MKLQTRLKLHPYDLFTNSFKDNVMTLVKYSGRRLGLISAAFLSRLVKAVFQPNFPE